MSVHANRYFEIQLRQNLSTFYLGIPAQYGLFVLICCKTHINHSFTSPILRIGDQVLTFDVFWPKHLQEVRSTVYIHVQSI